MKSVLLQNYYKNVGPGWTPVIESLGRCLERLIEDTPGAKITPSCVKEKFGGLRVYLEYEGMSTEQIEKAELLIEMAERVCVRICERCGKAGTPRTPAGQKYGWVLTLCEEHHAERDEEAKKLTAGKKEVPAPPPEEDEEEDEC